MPYKEENKREYQRGLKCSLWGQDVKDMDKEDLITFVGYLNEMIELIREGKVK